MADEVFLCMTSPSSLFGKGLLRIIYLKSKDWATIVDNCTCHVRTVKNIFYVLGDLPIPLQISCFIMCFKAVTPVLHLGNNQFMAFESHFLSVFIMKTQVNPERHCQKCQQGQPLCLWLSWWLWKNELFSSRLLSFDCQPLQALADVAVVRPKLIESLQPGAVKTKIFQGMVPKD